MTKKPIIPALTMLLTLVVLVHAAVLLVQQETAWWLVMDAACGVSSLGLCALSLICRKRGGTKTAWKIGLLAVQMLAAVVLQVVPMVDRNRNQLLFWALMAGIQSAVVNDMREEPTAYVARSISRGEMIFYKVMIGLEIALMIICMGVLIGYDEAVFYQAMELMGLSVLVMSQSIRAMRQNEAAEALKCKEDAENQQKLTQAGKE